MNSRIPTCIAMRYPSAFQVTFQSISVLLLISVHAIARPQIRDAFFSAYPQAVGSRLDSVPSKSTHCGVCHYDFNGGGTRNPYGVAIQNAGFALNTTSGRSNAIWSVRALDSDTDAYSSQVEVTNLAGFSNTPTFPGLASTHTNLVSNVTVSDIQNYLTPSIGSDNTPPIVRILSPNGGEVLTANLGTTITWTASDASGVSAVNIYLSLDNSVSFRPIALNLANSGTLSWTPPNRPSAQARIKVVARDSYFNSTNDVSDSVFAIVSPPYTNSHGVASTLRDFDLPGTQPMEHGIDLESSASCASCHGGYDTSVEPQHNWQGSMMSHASRDPLFLANMAIANQDAAESGDLCLRCHLPRGWLAGRSVPTDGSRMEPADEDGVSCALCHRMVNPVYVPGESPTNDFGILSLLATPGTEYGNGMFVIDPTGTRRGPYDDTVAPHSVLASSFHRSAAFCGTCHDVSNPAFQNDGFGTFNANSFGQAATNFSAVVMGPVERTYSEWLNSAYNTPEGVHAPVFAGARPGGFVSTCQDCHMRDIVGQGCNPTNGPSIRSDLPLHDLTGGSTWIPGLLTNLFPNEVNSAAIRAGIERSVFMLTNAASLSVSTANGGLRVTVTNECGHKLPTGYPEGRRIWVNVRFYDDALNLVGESGAYDPDTGILTHDAQAKIYEVHPGLEMNLANALNLPPGPSFHFVLNNRIYSDNRIPPRGFSNQTFSQFGGAPVDYSYADGQYWDHTDYPLPVSAVRAEVRLYYQSTSKEFVEFLRDANTTNEKGQELFDLWDQNGKCPPTLMAQVVWVPEFVFKHAGLSPENNLQIQFRCRPGLTYTIEFTDDLDPGATWRLFQNNGTMVADEPEEMFEDDFTPATSGAPAASGRRFYRIRYQTGL